MKTTAVITLVYDEGELDITCKFDPDVGDDPHGAAVLAMVAVKAIGEACGSRDD